MNSKRTYFLMLGMVGIITILILGGAYESKSILTSKSNKLVELKAKRHGYEDQLTNLTKAKKDLVTYDALYKIAKVVVPENKNQAETVRQIVKLAADNSINLGSISFPTSTLGAGPIGAGAASGSGQAPGAKLNVGSADLSQLAPVKGSTGVYVLQISVASDSSQPADYNQLINFLSALENNRLTAEVTSVNIVPDSTYPDRFSFSLILNSYIKP